MKTKETTVRLLSWTANPLGTIYAQWIQSRTSGPVPNPAKVETDMHDERIRIFKDLTEEVDTENFEALGLTFDNVPAGPFEKEVLSVVEKVLAMKMPLAETISFVILIENMPIALREQLVRHRIGHKFGDVLGADIVPDLAGSSSFWSQTTRIIDMGKFATEGDYLTPHWLSEHGEEPMPGSDDAREILDCLVDTFKVLAMMQPKDIASNLRDRIERVLGHHKVDGDGKTKKSYYHLQMRWIQAAYRRLVAAGMPLEDARNILPVAMQHRMTWTCNLANLAHVMSRRGCWLAQLGMWEPVIRGLIDELATKIHPMFRRMIDPPCFDANGQWQGCAFRQENEEIMQKDGEYPPCSLWLNKDVKQIENGHENEGFLKEKWLPRYNRMKERYTQLWGRDPKTGHRVSLTEQKAQEVKAG